MNFFGIVIPDAKLEAALALPEDATDEEIAAALGFVPPHEMLESIRRLKRAALSPPVPKPLENE